MSLGSRLVVTGHSIPDNVFQSPWAEVIRDAGFSDRRIWSSTGPFAAAAARWQNDYVAPHAVRALMEAPGASFDLFLGTEAHGGGYTGWVAGQGSSVLAHIQWSDAYGYALRWHNLAASTGAKTFYSNFWRSDPSETFGSAWRAAQEQEVAPWDGIIDHVNANRAGGTAPMRLVPWLQVFMAVHDAIRTGEVTGLSFSGMFRDDVHAESREGQWLQMATIMAVMYQRHPNELSNTWGLQYGGTASIDARLAAQLRPVVWAACLSNPRTGLG